MSEVTSVREPRTYSKDSPHSYLADVASASSPAWRDYSGATARLEQYSHELRGELRANRHSSESKHIIKSVMAEVRSNHPDRSREEFRAMTTGSSSGLSFVTPEYLVTEFRLFREYPPSFLEQLPCQPVPDFGMTVNIPAVEGPASVAAQVSEGSGASSLSPTGGYLSATLSTFAGSVLISQQLLDRSGPGVTFDQVAYKQMRQEYDGAVDSAVLTTAISGAQTVSDSTVYAASTYIPNLYGDLFNGQQKLETYSGTKLRATHHFFDPVTWAFVASQTGNDERPVLLPNANPNADTMLRVGEQDQVPGGYTGYNFAGIPAFVDGNMPLTSSNNTILVVNAGSLYPFVDQQPTLQVVPQIFAADLQVLVRLHGYAATVVLFPKGVCAISGAAYPTNPSFAG